MLRLYWPVRRPPTTESVISWDLDSLQRTHSFRPGPRLLRSLHFGPATETACMLALTFSRIKVTDQFYAHITWNVPDLVASDVKDLNCVHVVSIGRLPPKLDFLSRSNPTWITREYMHVCWFLYANLCSTECQR
jgi:hypothetical protein